MQPLQPAFKPRNEQSKDNNSRQVSSFKAQKTIMRPEKRKYCYDQVCVYCILSYGLGEFRGFTGYKIPRRLSSYYLIFPCIEKTFPIDISFMQRAHLPFQGSPARPTVSILQVGNFAVSPQHSPAHRWGSGRAVLLHHQSSREQEHNLH